MSQITLENIRHSYIASPAKEEDWALKQMDVVWQDAGAYALLGPSGCGKTTLLNIISGLLIPSFGRVLFGDRDVTGLPPDQRHIAQVFQFPVVYDTMSVFDNLAFPLRNRGAPEDAVKKRVEEVAEILDLKETLHNRASRLTADGKQKISLGRGLVRSDVNVIMFDEPLTVIDPQLKWILRSKLKELHQKVGATMIYVTHDQTEALTFADQVVVMHEGTVVQIGTPLELFEKPKHTFVGYFIGSPGMNVLPCKVADGKTYFIDNIIEVNSTEKSDVNSKKLELGVRPEFVSFSKTGIPVRINRIDDVGRYKIVETQHEQHIIKMVVSEEADIPSESVQIEFNPEKTHVYRDGWLAF